MAAVALEKSHKRRAGSAVDPMCRSRMDWTRSARTVSDYWLNIGCIFEEAALGAIILRLDFDSCVYLFLIEPIINIFV